MLRRGEVDRRVLACFVNSTQGGDLLGAPINPINPSSTEEAEAEGGACSRHGSGESK